MSPSRRGYKEGKTLFQSIMAVQEHIFPAPVKPTGETSWEVQWMCSSPRNESRNGTGAFAASCGTQTCGGPVPMESTGDRWWSPGQGGEGCCLPLWGTVLGAPHSDGSPIRSPGGSILFPLFCCRGAWHHVPFPRITIFFPQWTFLQHGYERFVLCTVEVVLSTWTSACLICKATSQWGLGTRWWVLNISFHCIHISSLQLYVWS